MTNKDIQSDLSHLIKDEEMKNLIEVKDIRGDNNHYHAKIVSQKFKGLSKLKQHKMVYEAIGPHMGTTLHALMLTTSES